MGATAMIHVRLDEQVKQVASAALQAMGLSVSDAVRALLVRVAAEKALPFALRLPNATTRAAMAEADDLARAGQARFATEADLIVSQRGLDMLRRENEMRDAELQALRLLIDQRRAGDFVDLDAGEAETRAVITRRRGKRASL